MAYARVADEPRNFVAAAPAPRRSPGFFRRVFDAAVQGRQRAAEREIAAFLERQGALTDDAERATLRIRNSTLRF